MTDHSGLSALRERVGRMEVEVKHQSEKLKDHARYFESCAKRMEQHSQRLNNIEQFLGVVKWALLTIGTVLLEGLTGTLHSILKMAAALGNGS